MGKKNVARKKTENFAFIIKQKIRDGCSIEWLWDPRGRYKDFQWEII